MTVKAELLNREQATTSDRLPRDEDGLLSLYAWPGGYNLAYVDDKECSICAECARAVELDEDETPPVAGYIYWEGPSFECDVKLSESCRGWIHSEYGDPNDDQS